MDTPLEDVERDLLLWAGRVAAGEAELLRLIGEWDAREGWGAAGALSCAHWVSWRLSMSPGASRERVRVARALRALPKTAGVLAEGRLSYAQARAITRIATEADEQPWLDLAAETTAEQLEKAVRGVKRALQPDIDAADPEEAEFRNRTRQRWDDQGNLELTFVIKAVDAPAVLAAIEQAQAAEQADRDQALERIAAGLAASPTAAPMPRSEAEGVPAGTSQPIEQAAPSAEGALAGTPEEYYFVEPDYPGMAYLGLLPSEKPAGFDAKIQAWHEKKDQLRAKAQAWADHQQRILEAAERQGAITRRATLTDGLVRLLTRDAAGHTKVKVTLLIDPMSGWARTSKDEFLPPAITAQILDQAGQSLPRIRPITSDDLLRLDQARTSRLVTPALRQLLGQLDGECCRFPGCTRTSKLQAHHVTFWRNGGRTDLSNLALVCSRHHTLIHQHGFVLELRADRTLIVTTTDNTRLMHLPPGPWQPKEDLDPAHNITTQSLPSQWNGDRLDVHHIAWVLAQHAA